MRLYNCSTGDYLYGNPKPGDIVEVFMKGVYECTARVIRRANHWRDLEPVPFLKLNEADYFNTVRKSYLCEVVSEDCFENGRQITRWLNTYSSRGVIKINPQDTGERPPESFEVGDDANDLI